MRDQKQFSLHGYSACVALAISLCVALAACGATTDQGLKGATHASSTLATPTAIALPATSVTAAGSSPGIVSLVLDGTQYSATSTIHVTIHNGLSSSILAKTNHSDCELVTLERLMSGIWQVAAGCSGVLPAPRVEQIAAGGALAQAVAPERGGPVGGTAGASWPAGTYRVVLQYVTSASQPFAQGTTVYSASFTIG